MTYNYGVNLIKIVTGIKGRLTHEAAAVFTFSIHPLSFCFDIKTEFSST